jgi:hypothetical protein
MKHSIVFSFLPDPDDPTTPNDDSKRALAVRLPMKPRTVEELRLLRRWIPTICAASYRRIFARCFFNPDFLRLFFPSPATAGPGRADRPSLFPVFQKKNTRNR